MWLAVVGRPAPSGPLDDLTLQQGGWATRPGEIDIDRHLAPFPVAIGSTVTVASAPAAETDGGRVHLVDRTGRGGLGAPSQVAALRPASAPAQQQMLYTFASAGTAAQVRADLATSRPRCRPGRWTAGCPGWPRTA